LNVFLTVVESGGFMPAQLTLNVSQSTLSSHMSALEARLDMRLCERGRSGFRVTQSGQQVYEAAQRLFRSIESFSSEVEAMRGKLTGALHIGTVDSVVTNPEFALSKAIGRFNKRFGEVRINQHIAPPAEVERAVVEGRFHIGIGGYTKRISALEYTPLMLERQRLYCSKRHPLFERAAGTLKMLDIAPYGYVKQPYVSDTHIPSAERLNATAYAENMEAIAILILSGSYIGFLPDHYAAQWYSSGEMRPLLPKRMCYESQIELILRKTVPQPLAAQYLKAELLEAFDLA
jgi:DNA-binding transcriptional LysR family regulator